MRRVACTVTLLVGCAHTSYVPHVVARGELVLRSGANLEMWAAGHRIASAIGWKGLESFVRCVPESQLAAHRARKDGLWSLALSVIGGSLAVTSVASIGGIADKQREHAWLGAGVGVAAVGIVLAGSSVVLRNRANGSALDALNFYNDSVGSLGATCDDLTYPPSSSVSEPPPHRQ